MNAAIVGIPLRGLTDTDISHSSLDYSGLEIIPDWGFFGTIRSLAQPVSLTFSVDSIAGDSAYSSIPRRCLDVPDTKSIGQPSV